MKNVDFVIFFNIFLIVHAYTKTWNYSLNQYDPPKL